MVKSVQRKEKSSVAEARAASRTQKNKTRVSRRTRVQTTHLAIAVLIEHQHDGPHLVDQLAHCNGAVLISVKRGHQRRVLLQLGVRDRAVAVRVRVILAVIV